MNCPLQPTKLVKLKHIPNIFSSDNNFYVKVENTNPSGSVKDIAVYSMLKGHQEKGLLKEGTKIIEATSGNTGISLAFFASHFHYEAIIVMPSSMSNERREMIRSYGATLVLVDGGMKQAEDLAIQMVKDTPNSVLLDQFNNVDNIKGHYEITGPEILSDLPNIDIFVAGFGTGGTVSGAGQYLKEHKQDVKVIAVEPFESPLLTKGEFGKHLIQGIGANFIPNNLNRNVVDEFVDVKGLRSIEMAKLIRNMEGLDVGYSSGAAVLGAIEYANKHDLHNKNIVIILPDKGDRYSW